MAAAKKAAKPAAAKAKTTAAKPDPKPAATPTAKSTAASGPASSAAPAAPPTMLRAVATPAAPAATPYRPLAPKPAPAPMAPPSGGPGARAIPAGNPFWNATIEVARKEFLQHLRTKRLLILGPIFLVVMVLITIVIPMLIIKNAGTTDLSQAATIAGTSIQNLALVFFFSGFLFFSGYFYLELMPILLTADAVCSEWSSRTIFLLLSRPVSRGAFVLGKFLGSIFTVGALVVSLMLVDYLAMQVLLPGSSSGADWLNFLGALGVLVLGVSAFTSIALFFGTLTRSAIVANILAVLTWIMVLPILAHLDTFIAMAQHGIDALSNPGAYNIGWARYLSPHESMQAAGRLLAPRSLSSSDLANSPLSLFGFNPPNVGPAVIALLVQTGLFLGLSFWVVQRRNFE